MKLKFFLLATLLTLTLLATAKADTNLAPITSWSTYEYYPSSFTANIHLDNTVTYMSTTTIRIDPHTGSDSNINRECDNLGISVSAGDRVVFSCWIKTSASTMHPEYNNDLTNGKGERIGMDFYTYTDHWIVVGGALINGYVKSDGTAFSGLPLAEAAGSAVPWNTSDWTEQTIDCIIPSGYSITGIIPWVQTLDVSDSALSWFADAELYVNPSTPTPSPTPTSTATPTSSPSPIPSPTSNPVYFSSFPTPTPTFSFPISSSIPVTVNPDIGVVLGIILAVGVGFTIMFTSFKGVRIGGK